MESEIYFISAEEVGRFKIGRSKHLSTRLQELQIGSPVQLKCLARTPAREPARLFEVLCHEAARTQHWHRVHGEWFEGYPTVEDCTRIVKAARARLDRIQALEAPAPNCAVA